MENVEIKELNKEDIAKRQVANLNRGSHLSKEFTNLSKQLKAVLNSKEVPFADLPGDAMTILERIKEIKSEQEALQEESQKIEDEINFLEAKSKKEIPEKEMVE